MNIAASPIQSSVTEAEWQQRVDLAACYRLVALFGWDDLIFTHISARVPGPDHHFLINPYGMLFGTVVGATLVANNNIPEEPVGAAFWLRPIILAPGKVISRQDTKHAKERRISRTVGRLIAKLYNFLASLAALREQ